jgi:hypothetical protein
MRRAAYLFRVAALTLALSSCASEFGRAKINVNGMIYDFENRPLPNYTIALGKKYSAFTDINGRFFLPKVRAGRYEASGRKSGYESFKGEIIVSDKKQIVYLRIPSSGQLLDLAGDALSKNQIDEAGEFTRRAYNIGVQSTELLFYMAVVAFRKKDYPGALYYLQTAVDSGFADEYVHRFLDELKERYGNEN